MSSEAAAGFYLGGHAEPVCLRQCVDLRPVEKLVTSNHPVGRIWAKLRGSKQLKSVSLNTFKKRVKHNPGSTPAYCPACLASYVCSLFASRLLDLFQT